MSLELAVPLGLELAGGLLGWVDPAVPLQGGEDIQDWQAALLFAAMCFAVGMVSLKLGADRYRKSRVVKNTSTEQVRSMAVGRTELNGTARPYDGTYEEPFRDGEAVVADWRVSEWREKNPHDDEDDTKTWKQVASGRLGDRVVLEDDTGAVALERPPMGDLSNELTWETEVGPGTVPPAKVGEFLESQGVSTASGDKRRYRQRVIRDGTELYVFGEAGRRDDDTGEEPVFETLGRRYDDFVDELLLSRDSSTDRYIVSDKDEDEISRGAFLRTLAFLLCGVAFVALGAGLLAYGLQLNGML